MDPYHGTRLMFNNVAFDASQFSPNSKIYTRRTMNSTQVAIGQVSSSLDGQFAIAVPAINHALDPQGLNQFAAMMTRLALSNASIGRLANHHQGDFGHESLGLGQSICGVLDALFRPMNFQIRNANSIQTWPDTSQWPSALREPTTFSKCHCGQCSQRRHS